MCIQVKNRKVEEDNVGNLIFYTVMSIGTYLTIKGLNKGWFGDEFE